MTGNEPAAPKPERSFAVTMARRIAIALALVAIMLLPSVVLFVITKQPSATYASIGALVGIIAVVAGGVRIGVITAIVVGLLAPITIIAGLSPVTGAAIMALMTMTVGRLATFGLHRAVMLVPIMMAWPLLTPVPWIPDGLVAEVQSKLTAAGMTLTEAVAHAQSGSGSASTATTEKITQALIHQRIDTQYLGWVAFFFFIGAIVPVMILPFALRKVPRPAPVMHPRSETVPYTATITVLAAGATYYCLDHPKLVAGSFLIATILVLTQLGNDIEWKLTIERILGTLGGVLLLTGLMKIVGTISYTEILGVPMPTTVYLVGLVLGVLAVVAKFSPRQWIYYVLIAPAAAMLNAFTSAQVTDFGAQRVADNLVGAILVIIAAAITFVGSRLMGARRRGDSSVEAPRASPA
ncbi:MAG: hypothetical protein FGM58_08040 [Acidimicrobiia bacterium]|nr:hypothetical protein [Acidimicrobiia bacterium]